MASLFREGRGRICAFSGGCKPPPYRVKSIWSESGFQGMIQQVALLNARQKVRRNSRAGACSRRMRFFNFGGYMTDKEILDIARMQSAWDLSCSLEDFSADQPVVVVSKKDARKKKFMAEVNALEFHTYGTNVVASVSEEIKEDIIRFLSDKVYYITQFSICKDEFFINFPVSANFLLPERFFYSIVFGRRFTRLH